LDDSHPRLFAGQRERHKNSLALHVRQKRAAVDWLFDLDELGLGGLRCNAAEWLHCWLM
jgi:hypothetical protein